MNEKLRVCVAIHKVSLFGQWFLLWAYFNQDFDTYLMCEIGRLSLELGCCICQINSIEFPHYSWFVIYP